MQSSGEFRLTEPLSTALVEAALRGDKSGVFRLIGQGSWVEQRDSMWKTRPVIGQPEHIRQLAAPANWQVCSGWSATPALLPTHRRDASGYTALLRAAGQGDVANVKRLLQVGADREARNLHGNTALMLAAEKNRYHVIEALLAAHADPRATNYARPPRQPNTARTLRARPPPAHCALSSAV